MLKLKDVQEKSVGRDILRVVGITREASVTEEICVNICMTRVWKLRLVMDVVNQQLTNITVNSARKVSAQGVLLKKHILTTSTILTVLDVDQSMCRLQ